MTFNLPQNKGQSQESIKDGHNSSLDWEEDDFAFRKPDHPVRTRYSTDSNEFAGFSDSSASETKKDSKRESEVSLPESFTDTGCRKRSIAFVDTSPIVNVQRRKSAGLQQTGGTGLTMEISNMELGMRDKSCQELAFDSGDEADVSMAESTGLDSSAEDVGEGLNHGEDIPVAGGLKTSSPVRRVSFEFNKSVEEMSLGTPGIGVCKKSLPPTISEHDEEGLETRDQIFEMKTSFHSSNAGSLEQFRKRMSLDARSFSFGPSDQSSQISSSYEQMRRKSLLRSSPDQSQLSAMSCDFTPANQRMQSRIAEEPPMPTFVS